MPTPDLRALLVEAPVGRHFAQLHRSHDTLLESLGLYVVTGLQRGEGVVVIASPEHTHALLRHAWYYDLAAEAMRRSGQLVLLDAEETLAMFMHRGMPDWKSFLRSMETVITAASLGGNRRVRAYGEMVDLLWQAGRHAAAIQLEDYWNELARLHSFSLFCSYVLDSHDHRCYQAPLHGIGRTHSDVHGTADDDEFKTALDRASRDVFGVPLPRTIEAAGHEDQPGEAKLPAAQRTMLWIMRHMPSHSADVLARARAYLARRQPSLGVA